MDNLFTAISAGGPFPKSAAEALEDDGFVTIPGPIAPERMPRFVAAYDLAMATGNATDLAVGKTTTRLWDFVNRDVEFDDLYIYPTLLQACSYVIGVPFKLSTTLGRTLRPHTAAQELHVDSRRDSHDLPMVGFIFMVDEFRPDNGATRFVPGSHQWRDGPEDVMPDRCIRHEREVLACGPAGSFIIFNGSAWHGHTANQSARPRRSIQGYFVRRDVRSGIDLPGRMTAESLARIGPLARYILAV